MVVNTKKVSAQERMWERNKDAADRPRVSVWFPASVPWSRLQTIGHGCQQPDTLPPGPPVAYLTMGGIEFGGYLEDLELMIAAAAEALEHTRSVFEEMQAAQPPVVGGPGQEGEDG